MRTHTETFTRARAHTHIHTRMHTHTYTYTQLHTRTYTHTHTHTHTHTRSHVYTVTKLFYSPFSTVSVIPIFYVMMTSFSLPSERNQSAAATRRFMRMRRSTSDIYAMSLYTQQTLQETATAYVSNYSC